MPAERESPNFAALWRAILGSSVNTNARTGFAAPLLLAAFGGATLGLGAYTFVYAHGFSYLTDRPAACANCHAMRGHYESWMASSHHDAAVCNDCHTPPGLAAKYGARALNGFFHSLAFSTGRFPDRLRITPRGMRVARSACLKCHAGVTAGVRMTRDGSSPPDCVRCHAAVGHL